MKINPKIMAVAGLLIAGFILAGSVSAFGGKGMGFDHFFVSSDTRTQLEDAIQNHDYEAFKAVQAENFPNAPVLSEEQFNRIADQRESMQKIEAAIANGNYDEWKTLVSQQNDPHSQMLLSKITSDNFHLLKELQDAQNKIQSIHAELGFEPHMMMGFGPGPHMKMRMHEGEAAVSTLPANQTN